MLNNPKEFQSNKAQYDIIHFEALGPEAKHLKEEILKAQQKKELPEEHKYLITPSNVQAFLKENPEIFLPEIITTKTHSILPESYLEGNKKSIITRSAGYDHFEYLAEKANITSLREYCVNAVAQTAMKFLYVTAGELNHYTKNTATFERNNSNAFMELDKHKILTVYGVGKIGKRIYELAEVNGLTVQGVDIRQEQLNDAYEGKVTFVSKENAIETSDVIVNAMNLTRNAESRFYNIGYFSKEYLSKAKTGILFINITRGEIAPESGLLELYLSETIKGIGLDVFTNESQFAKLLNDDAVTGNDLSAAQVMVKSSIDRTANIYVQPHQGFNSDVAARTKAVEAIKHVISWYNNKGRCFDEQLPYY
ncbi:MAG: hydroxyacid dehydrogenase [Syntrophus sp. (in: bacteria)]|nr:hydroxyacid dehydrogenase [Syntrophus sp. (in: bacteria)]